MSSTDFDDFYYDDTYVLPEERAKIEYEVESIGKMIEEREANVSREIGGCDKDQSICSNVSEKDEMAKQRILTNCMRHRRRRITWESQDCLPISSQQRSQGCHSAPLSGGDFFADGRDGNLILAREFTKQGQTG